MQKLHRKGETVRDSQQLQQTVGEMQQLNATGESVRDSQ